MLGSLGMSLPPGALAPEEEAQLNAAMAGSAGSTRWSLPP
jgi:hypothetical protein